MEPNHQTMMAGAGLQDGASTKIKGPLARVVGCGGAGCNVLREFPHHVAGLELKPLNNVRHPPFRETLFTNPLLLRDVARTGDLALKHAEDGLQEHFQTLFDGANVAFILAGLGGGTGSWAAAVACRVAHGMGLLTLPFVTIPFRVEGPSRHAVAMEALPILMANADLTTTLANDKLLKLVPNMPMARAFQTFSRITASAVLTLHAALSHSDAALLGGFLQPSREGRLGMGSARGEHAAFRAVEEAFQSPWFDFPLERARKALVVIEGVASHSNEEKEVLRYTEVRLPGADVLSNCLPHREDKVRVILLVGLQV